MYQVTTRNIYWLFGFWLAVGIICNDVTNFGSVRLGINVRPDRIFYVILVLAALTNLARRGRLLALNRVEKLMGVFFVICLLSCIIGGAINNPRNKYLSNVFNFAFIPLTLFAITRRLGYSPECAGTQFRLFQIIGLYLGLTGIFEHFGTSSLIWPKYILDPSIGYHFGRSRGPFVQSVAMGAAVNLLFFWLLWYHRFVRKSWLNIATMLACMATAYFTDTRSVWLQFAGSTAVLVIFSKQLRKPAAGVCLLLALVYVSGIASKFSPYQTSLFSRRDGPVDDRINIAYASMRMFAERPVFGFGYGKFVDCSDPYFKQIEGVKLRGQGEGQHHTILGLLADMGLVGTVPFLTIYAVLALSCFQQVRQAGGKSGPQTELLVAQMAVLGGVAILMQFGDIRDFNFVNDMVFWMAGITYAVRERRGVKARTVPAPQTVGNPALLGARARAARMAASH